MTEFVFTSSGTFGFVLGLALFLGALVSAGLVLAHKAGQPIAKESFGIACVFAVCGVIFYFLYRNPLTVAVGHSQVVVHYPWPREDRRVPVGAIANALEEKVGTEQRTPGLVLVLADGERIDCGAAQEDHVIEDVRRAIDEEYHRLAPR